MNERIEELADRAEAYAQAEYDKWTPTPNFSGVPNIRAIYNQKFAELIIRECAKFLEANSGYDQSNNAWHPEPEDLLEHFGVKE